MLSVPLWNKAGEIGELKRFIKIASDNLVAGDMAGYDRR